MADDAACLPAYSAAFAVRSRHRGFQPNVNKAALWISGPVVVSGLRAVSCQARLARSNTASARQTSGPRVSAWCGPQTPVSSSYCLWTAFFNRDHRQILQGNTGGKKGVHQPPRRNARSKADAMEVRSGLDLDTPTTQHWSTIQLPGFHMMCLCILSEPEAGSAVPDRDLPPGKQSRDTPTAMLSRFMLDVGHPNVPINAHHAVDLSWQGGYNWQSAHPSGILRDRLSPTRQPDDAYTTSP